MTKKEFFLRACKPRIQKKNMVTNLKKGFTYQCKVKTISRAPHRPFAHMEQRVNKFHEQRNGEKMMHKQKQKAKSKGNDGRDAKIHSIDLFKKKMRLLLETQHQK